MGFGVPAFEFLDEFLGLFGFPSVLDLLSSVSSIHVTSVGFPQPAEAGQGFLK